MPTMTALLQALSALARTPSGAAALAGPAPSTDPAPVALTHAELDQVTGGGSPIGGVINDREGSPAPYAGKNGIGSSGQF
jgi:hypothetical protein